MTLIRSARTRLVIASALMGILAMTIVLALVYWTANRIIEAETRNVVTAELNGLADSYSSLGVLGLARAIERRIDSEGEPEALYLLTDRFGQTIAGNIGAWPPTIEPGSGWVKMNLIRTDIDRTVPIAAASFQLRGGERLLVGRDASGRQRFEKVLGQSLALALAVAVALSLMTGWLLTRLVFSRIGEISNTAREIVSGDLSMRMPARGEGDEFDRLAGTLNEMLDRIEALVANLRMTTDSLSHDLRSPLTRLRGQIETLMAGDLTPADREEVSSRALSEVDHLLRVFNDLTEIARAEAGLAREDFEPVDLAAISEDVAEFYQPLAQDRGVTINTDIGPASVAGHQALLSQALSNLLENALRYAPKGSEVSVRTGSDGDTATITVADHGRGVPASDRDRVLKPFVTLDPSRTEGMSGLGLALVASVARMHDGTLKLEDNQPGLKLSMTMKCLAKGPT